MKINIILSYFLGVILIIGCSDFQSSPIVNKKAIETQIQFLNPEHKQVFEELKIKDSLLFTLGFNQCDTNQVKNLTSKDFEFYHDQAGITNSQNSFVQSISGLCGMNYKPTRKLEKNSLSVHLLKNNGKIYGAIQNGNHSFYGKEKNKPEYLTSTAEFIHLWIIENENWKLKRVLSYNHKQAENE